MANGTVGDQAALTSETVKNILDVKDTLQGSYEIMEVFHALQSEEGYCEPDHPGGEYNDLMPLNNHVAVVTGEDRGEMKIYLIHRNSDYLIRPPDLILSREDLEEFDSTELWGDYAISDGYLTRKDIKALLNFANGTYETQESDWVNRIIYGTLGRPSPQEPEEFKEEFRFVLNPSEEGVVQIYQRGVRHPIIYDIRIETLGTLHDFIEKKRLLSKYIRLPEHDTTQPQEGIEGIFHNEVTFNLDNTKPTTYSVCGHAIGEGTCIATYKPKDSEIDYAQIRSNIAGELAEYESRLKELGVLIDDSTGTVHINEDISKNSIKYVVLTPNEIRDIWGGLKEQWPHEDGHYTTDFGDASKYLKVPPSDIRDLNVNALHNADNGYKITELFRHEPTGIIGIKAEPRGNDLGDYPMNIISL